MFYVFSEIQQREGVGKILLEHSLVIMYDEI